MGALTLEVSKVGLLVEAGARETERVDDVVDLDDLILEGLLSLLCGGVGANVWDNIRVSRRRTTVRKSRGRRRFRRLLTDLNVALGDHGAVGLVDDPVDLLQVVRVRDHLVVGDNVLWGTKWVSDRGTAGGMRRGREGGRREGTKRERTRIVFIPCR